MNFKRVKVVVKENVITFSNKKGAGFIKDGNWYLAKCPKCDKQLPKVSQPAGICPRCLFNINQINFKFIKQA